jgi:shikimate dehydrogenase
MKTYGLVGKNIDYSLSPFMHNAAFKSLRLDAEYRIFDIPETGLAEFFSKLRKNMIAGCNVTIPYKEKALGLVDRSSSVAEFIGALNTVTNEDGGLRGDNTDYQGFLKALRGKDDGSLNFEPNGKNAFIFGAGGAAKAVIYVLSILGIKKVVVTDIDLEKAEGLAGFVSGKEMSNISIAVAHDKEQYEEFISKSDILINATPCGMKKDDPELFDYRYLHEKLYVFDLIYSCESRLVKEAHRRAARAVNGVNMLLYQAAASFTLWTGKDAPLEVMRKALLERIK